MEKILTAVEWLYDKIKHGITKKQFDEFILEAQEMEKQQIEDALFTNDFDYESGNDYYKQTFKSEDDGRKK
jgi:hypothetical protein